MRQDRESIVEDSAACLNKAIHENIAAGTVFQQVFEIFFIVLTDIGIVRFGIIIKIQLRAAEFGGRCKLSPEHAFGSCGDKYADIGFQFVVIAADEPGECTALCFVQSVNDDELCRAFTVYNPAERGCDKGVEPVVSRFGQCAFICQNIHQLPAIVRQSQGDKVGKAIGDFVRLAVFLASAVAGECSDDVRVCKLEMCRKK